MSFYMLCVLLATSCASESDAVADWVSGGANYPDRDVDRNPKSIIVMSDIHVMAPELLESKGEAYDAYLADDAKLLEYSDEVLDVIIGEALQRSPDLVIIPGDLTKDGELVSHQLVVTMLGRLRAAGIQVVVVPGNHDIDNPNGKYFNGSETRAAERTSPQQFVNMYADFGYGIAFARDAASLSYACEPLEGLVLLCIDSNRYEENLYIEKGDERNYNQTAGRIRKATLKWMMDVADEARKAGKQVAVVQHHNALQHHDAQASILGEYVIDDYEEVGHMMMNHGIHLVFTGHQHVQDIAQYRVGENAVRDSLVDVASGSTITYPNPWLTITASNEFTKWKIGTEYVRSTLSEADIRGASYKCMAANVYSILGNNIRWYWNEIDGYRDELAENKLPENFIPSTPEELTALVTEYLGPQVIELVKIHYEGNEGRNPRSEQLIGEIKSNMAQMCRKRFADIGVNSGRISTYMMVFNSMFDSKIRPYLVSLLTDVNQMDEGAMRSITDDISTVLYLPWEHIVNSQE